MPHFVWNQSSPSLTRNSPAIYTQIPSLSQIYTGWRYSWNFCMVHCNAIDSMIFAPIKEQLLKESGQLSQSGLATSTSKMRQRHCSMSNTRALQHEQHKSIAASTAQGHCSMSSTRALHHQQQSNPLNNDHPWCQTKMTFVEGWSLLRGRMDLCHLQYCQKWAVPPEGNSLNRSGLYWGGGNHWLYHTKPPPNSEILL